jgi:hypothetical protein
MNRLASWAAAAAVIVPTSALALAVDVSGRVDYSHSTYAGSGPGTSLSDTQSFATPVTPDVITDFAVAAPVLDNIHSFVVVSAGDGWMRAVGSAISVVNATPDGVETGATTRYNFHFRVQDTVTIDAPNRTGQPGTAVLGFNIDGVLSASSDVWVPHSDGYACGIARFGATLQGTTSVSAYGGGNVFARYSGCSLDPDEPPSLGFDDFLGGLIDFTYGTPIHLDFWLLAEGRARAASDWEDGLAAASVMVADFGRTITWAGVSDLRDGFGNPVDDFTALSSRGADFRFAVAAPGVDGTVPEPSTLLLAAAAAALALRRQVRRRAASSRPG